MISILFEDDDLLAVDKPEGLAAIPERLGRNKSLFEMLSAAVSYTHLTLPTN